MHAKGTICHKYTDADFERISRGDFLPGISRRSQRFALERHIARLQLGQERGKRHKEPEMPVFKGYEFSTGEWV